MSLIRLVSWNVNGYRAVTQKPDWAPFLASDIDIVALQETKAHPDQLTEAQRFPEGFTTHWCSSIVKKGYSGVAVMSKPPVIHAQEELPDALYQGEGRLLHIEYEHFHLCNVYFPNGQIGDYRDTTPPEELVRLHYKMGFYDAFLKFSESLRVTKPVVVCGDFNTAHSPIDLARPKANVRSTGFLPMERAWLDSFVEHGYIDTFRLIHGDIPDKYTWWSYKSGARPRNVGWRIDYVFVSEELRPHVKDAWIADATMGSDHCPVGVALDFE